MIKVLIVDDSNFIRKTIRQMLSYDHEIEVIDEAGDGREAIEKTIALKPDVITMDIIMPGIDGVWALEEIMKQRPTPIIILSSVGLSASDIIQESFSLGVVDIVTKPEGPQNIPIISKELIEKVKAASKVGRLRLLEYKTISAAKKKTFSHMKAHQVVVIVTSAGGPPSLYEIISKFSEKFYAGVIVAQHLPSNFLDSFTSHIQKMTSMQVKIADKGDLLFSRRILFSPTNATLELHQTKKGALVDIVDHKTRLQPDIDKVIISCANVFKSATTLVVLSGLGSDGVKGAEVVKKYGGKVIVEDKATAGIYVGMPLSVVKSGFYDTTCPSYGIAEMIENILSNKTNAVAPKNSLVKGIVLRAIVSFLRTKCAPEDYSSVMDALSEASRNALTNSLNAYNYYPLEIYYEITDTINKSCSEKNKNIIDDLAMSIVQECYFMYKQGFPVANPENFISFIPTFQKVIFPGDSWEVLSISNDQKRAELIDHNDTFNDNNIQLFAKMTCGWLKHLFVLAGFSSRDCRVEQGADQKGQFIKCTVSWN